MSPRKQKVVAVSVRIEERHIKRIESQLRKYPYRISRESALRHAILAHFGIIRPSEDSVAEAAIPA